MNSLCSLWSETAPTGPELHPFEPGSSADVIVVGGGITGLSAALHIAGQGGQSVSVLEAETPGWGTSGQAGGQVIAGLHAAPDDLVATFGDEMGERMLSFVGKAPDLVFQLIERYRIDCNPVRKGWIQTNRSTRGVRALQRHALMWAKRGAPVEMLDRAQTARLVGTQVYAGGWLDRRNGTVQPLAYTRGLAKAAIEAGAKIHGNVRVQKLTRDNGRWRVTTNAGHLIGSVILIATNAFTDCLVPRLQRSILRVHGVQIATAPLSDSVRATILPQGHSCADNHILSVRYFRVEPDNRLVIGGPGWLTPPRNARALSFRILERSARRMFPQIANTPFDYHWYGRGAVTADLLPHLHEPQSGIIAALGYNGRGIAAGTALGALLARRALGEPARDLPFPVTALSALPFNTAPAARYYLSIAADRLRHLFD